MMSGSWAKHAVLAVGILFALGAGARYFSRNETVALVQSRAERSAPESVSINHGAGQTPNANETTASIPSETAEGLGGSLEEPPGAEEVTAETRVAMDAIRDERIAWLYGKMRTGGFCASDFRHGATWLRICLMDQAARNAFERYLLERLADMPGGESVRLAAMRTLAVTDSGLFRAVLGKAIDGQKWGLVAAGLRAAPNADLPPEDFLRLARRAVNGDSYTRCAAVLSVEALLPSLPRDDAAQLLRDICRQADFDPAVPSQVAFALAGGGLSDAENDLDMYERLAVDGATPAARCIGITQSLQAALMAAHAADSAQTAYEYAARIPAILTEALEDPSPLVRRVAVGYYDQVVDQLHQITDGLK